MRTLRATFAVVMLIASVALTGQSASGPESKRPNILLVVADDHAQWAAAPYGHPLVRTPTLDFLAESGLMMGSATSVSPVCSPSRASLLTGRLPSQHGLHDFLREEPDFDAGWLQGELLLPELLQRVGYTTALIGKWHCGVDSTRPVRGFDRWLSYDVGPGGWRNQYDHRGRVFLSDQGRPTSADGLQTGHLVDAALRFIVGAQKKPWFVLLAPTDTHAPHEGLPERWVQRYRSTLDIVRGRPSFLPAANPQSAADDNLLEILAQYLAAVSHQDAEVGRLIDELDARGVLDETLVVYTSDHGLMVGQHGLVGKANATLPQNLYEEVVRVPMLLRWPGHLPAGERLDLPFDQLDLFHTLLHAAGVELGGLEKRVDSPGSNLFHYLDDPGASWRRYRFSEHGNARMVAGPRFKLVRRYPPLDPRFGDELYDLENDPGEHQNLAGNPAFREVHDRLESAIGEYFERFEDPRNSGLRVVELPPCNGREPWARTAAETAQEGVQQ